MPDVSPVRSLTVIVAADCNLRCAYCYQNAKRPELMPWPVLRRALQLLLASSAPAVDLLFSGGEPVLALSLIRRAVRFVEARRGRGPRVQFHLLTNGTLLGPRDMAFLVKHRFSVQVSFDGIPAAQRLRGRDTFGALDALLDRLRQEHGAWFRRMLSVNVTVLPRTVPFLADSIEYVLSKGVRDIVLTPVQGHQDEWQLNDLARLDEQAARIARACRRSLRQSGRVPVQFLRKAASDRRRQEPSAVMCGAADPRTLTVDVDGRVSGCALLAKSYQRFPDTALGRQVAGLRQGVVGDRHLPHDVRASTAQLAATGLFHNRPAKHSSYDRCGTCRYRRSCEICPMAIVWQPGNDDPDRIPDFACAFSRVTGEHRRRFPILRPRNVSAARLPSGTRS